MKSFTKRILSMLLAVCMVLSLAVSGLATPATEAIITTATGYTTAADVVYNTTDGIIANWGARGEVCYFISSYGESFYTGDYTYDALSALAGGTSTSNATSSALYTTLQNFMTDKHTTNTTYGGSSSVDCKYLYLYTDCVSGDTTQVSLYYRGGMVGSTWDSGVSYNQEHIWPQSKLSGSDSTDIGDIMHLRPANSSENSSRGNTAYGESDGYYDPGVSVRGDCARTVLYMYTRWGNTDYMWGADGVIESLDILLKWMEEDPVDTWEMGRNDAVQSITGTRNVYVDYPELAWQMFGVAEPADLVTPSGDDVPVVSKVATLVTDASTLKAGDQIVIVASDYNYAISTAQNTNNRGQSAVIKNEDGTVTTSADTQIITLEAGLVDGTFAFNVGDAGYLYAASSSDNYLKSTTTLDENGSWAIAIDATTGVATVTASGANTRNTMFYNASSSLFACYASTTTTQKAVSVYKITGTATETPDDSGSTEPSYQEAGLVTDVSTLQAGDQIVIVASGADFALGTTQNTNNRSAAGVTKASEGAYVYVFEDTQIITLEAGANDGTFAFNVGEAQYLYAPSSSSNHLKTQSTIETNGSWSITIDNTNGIASVLATGTTTRNDLRYNAQGMFSCYGAGNTQQTVCIYEVGATAGEFGSGDSGDSGTETVTQNAQLVTDASALQSGDKIVIVAMDKDFALGTAQNSNNRAQAAVTKDTNAVTFGTDTQIITLEPGTIAGTFAFNVGEAQYLCAVSSSSNYLRTTATLDDNASWNIVIDAATGKASVIAAGTYTRNDLRYNSSNGLFACYATDTTMLPVSIYKIAGEDTGACSHSYESVTTDATCSAAGSVVYTCTLCGDSYSQTIPAVDHSYTGVTTDATCTSAGQTVYTCSVCGHSYTETIAATGHSYVEGVCTVCGETMAVTASELTIDFSSAADRTSFSTTQQIWAKEGFVLTNNKDNSTSNVADYFNPVRFYKNSTLIFSGTSIAKLEIVCSSSSYATALNNSVTTDANVTNTVSDTVVTIEFSDPVDTYEIVLSGGQVRVNQATAYFTTAEAPHEHDYTAVVTAPTCTEGGYTTYNCASCGDSYVADETAAAGHSYSNGNCSTCGAADPDYVEPVIVPTLNLVAPTLNFEDEIYYNIYYTASDMTDVVEMGLITFDSYLAEGTIDDALEVIPGYALVGENYMSHTNGIPAKMLSDTLYFRVYAKLSDGTYAYSMAAGYHAVYYAKDILANSTNAEMKALVVAMLNYGAAAQTHFDYKTDALMNSFLTAEQQALVGAYSSDMVEGLTAVDQTKVGELAGVSGGYTALAPNVAFEGAFAINFYFTPAKAMDGELKLYYWTRDDYNAAETLTTENATGVVVMEETSTAGQYLGAVTGIAAKQIDQTIFVCGVYESDGVSYPTGVIAYSLASYCLDRIANGGATMQEFAKATVLYGYYAKAYFA